MAKNKKPKVKGTFAMTVAQIQQSSGLFAGFQMAGAYYAALMLSAISVVVGLTYTISQSNQFKHFPAYVSMPIGAVVGITAAFIFDGLTVSSLKRIKTSTKFWTVVPNFFTMAGGISFSTMAGDQMWSMFFGDWKSWVFAGAISAVLIATELWHKEHVAAVKKSVSRDDIVAHAQAEENASLIDQIRREESQALLKDPEFRDDLRKAAREELKQQLIRTMQAGSVHVTEEQEQPQLPAPEPEPEPQTDQLQLPEPAQQPEEPHTDELEGEFKVLPEPEQQQAPVQEQRADDVQESVQEQETETDMHTSKAAQPAQAKRAPARVQPATSRTKFDAKNRAKLARLLDRQPALSQNEIARQMGVSPHTVKNWIAQLETA